MSDHPNRQLPLSRRRFVTGSLGAVALTGLAGNTLAGQRGTTVAASNTPELRGSDLQLSIGYQHVNFTGSDNPLHPN